MSKKLNVFRSIMASAAGVSLLAACDGRGVTSFQPRTYTKAEVMAERARLNGEVTTSTTYVAGAPVKDQPALGHSESVVSDTSLLVSIQPQPATPVVAAPAPAAAPAQSNNPVAAKENVASVAAEPPMPMDGAKAKSMTELEPEQRKEGKRENIVGQIDAAMKTPVSQSTIKGLTLFGGPEGLGLDAVITVAGQERIVSVPRTSIEFDKDGLITPLVAEMKSVDGDKIPLGKSIYVLAFCADVPCVRAYLIFDVAAEKNRVVTAFELQYSAKNNQFGIVDSNMKEAVKSYKEVMAPAQKTEAPKKAEGTST